MRGPGGRHVAGTPFLCSMWQRIACIGSLAALVVACGGGQSAERSTPPADGGGAAGYAEGLAELEARILKESGNKALYAERARFQERFDSLDAAQRDWERALRIDSLDVDLHMALGDLFYRRIKVDQARKSFERAMEIDPTTTRVALRLAEIELVQRRYPRAMELANEALRRDPRNAKGYFIKGWIHKETGDTTLAISSLRTAVEQDPEYYDAFVQLGLLHTAIGDDLALQYLNTALEIAPNSGEALYAKGWLLQEMAEDSLAIEVYALLKEVDSMDARPWFNTGYILLEYMDRPNEAKREFDGAIARFPTYHQAYYNRGLAHERTAMLDSAALDYRRALALDPAMDLAAQGLERLQDMGIKVKPDAR